MGLKGRSYARSNNITSEAFACPDLQEILLADGRAVTGGQGLTVQSDGPSQNLDPGVTPVGERVLDRLAGVEIRQVDRGILPDPQGSVATIGGDDRP